MTVLSKSIFLLDMKQTFVLARADEYRFLLGMRKYAIDAFNILDVCADGECPRNCNTGGWPNGRRCIEQKDVSFLRAIDDRLQIAVDRIKHAFIHDPRFRHRVSVLIYINGRQRAHITCPAQDVQK